MNLEYITCEICMDLMGQAVNRWNEDVFGNHAGPDDVQDAADFFYFCSNCSDAEIEAYILKLQERKRSRQ